MDENHLESVIDDVHGMRDETINISDVIEVIETDLDFKESTTMYNGGGEVPQVQPQVDDGGPYVRIVEQPASKALRFRYECEGRSAGSIPGVRSTPENKSFPSIQVVGYQGRAVVVVSCVTKDRPYRAHPHNLVGRDGCKKGVCTMEIPPETMCATFSNLGIQCVKKKDIESALKLREEIKVDPFLEGFSHRNQPTSIDLNAVRLCFQVFLERKGKFSHALKPVVSEPIYDKKAMSDLVIVKLSDCNSYVDGGRKDIILLCEKVTKEDIQIRFFEEKNNQVVWEGFGDFQPSQVHKQTAIWFRAPRYHTLDITEPVKVSIQLRRPSDGASSEALPFEFLPLDSEPGMLTKRKRQKFDDPNHLLRHLEDYEKNRPQQQFLLNIPMEPIKIEPREKAPSPYGGQVYGGGISPRYAANSQHGVSPQYMNPTPPPPPTEFTFQNQQPNLFGNNLLPSIDTVNWNIPSTSTANLPNWAVPPTSNDLPAASSDLQCPTGLSSFLDLDSQQTELKQINLNSDELMCETNHLSESFTNNLSLTDIHNGGRHDHNMTDSLTRFANNALNDLLYKE